jgi:hypothetical protein
MPHTTMQPPPPAHSADRGRMRSPPSPTLRRAAISLTDLWCGCATRAARAGLTSSRAIGRPSTSLLSYFHTSSYPCTRRCVTAGRRGCVRAQCSKCSRETPIRARLLQPQPSLLCGTAALPTAPPSAPPLVPVGCRWSQVRGLQRHTSKMRC